MNKFGTLISAEWLNAGIAGNLQNIRVLDASSLSHFQRDSKSEYAEKHIPEASFFDTDICTDESSKFSNTVPRQSHFEDYVGHLGISNNTHVIVYDNSANGFFSAPRVWWMFRIFGHQSISLLNRGFPHWLLKGFQTTAELPQITKQRYSATFNKSMVKAFDDIARNIEDKEFQLVDARDAERFNVTDGKSTEGVNRGHIVGAVNIPYKSIIDTDTLEVKTPVDLAEMFADAKVDLNKPVVASCGTGVTACCLALAGHLCGKDIPVYDGSWTEWAVKSEPHQRVSPVAIEE